MPGRDQRAHRGQHGGDAVTYFNAAQQAQLLAPLNPARVGKDGKGFSHLEAWEIRRHLIRIFGHARWSCDLTDMELVFETSSEGDKPRWTVCYRATVCLTICAPDGEQLATYTEAACGDATNYPSRADAHDQAIKTAESQAFKRAAVNLGDGFGLSLYANGSTDAVVGRTLVNEPQQTGFAKTEQQEKKVPETTAEVDAEARDDATPEPASTPPPPDVPAVDPRIEDFRQQALDARTPQQVTRLIAKVTAAKLTKAQAADENGEPCELGALIQRRLRAVTNTPEPVAS